MPDIGATPSQIVIITGAGPSADALADSVDGPLAIPEPPVRPDAKAQWDEVHGCWIAWDDEAQKWQPESQPLVIDLREPSQTRVADDVRREVLHALHSTS